MNFQKSRTITVVFDFDHTLFSTKSFYRVLKENFKKLGVEEELFNKSFEESKGKGRDYKPKRQFRLIHKAKPKIKIKDLQVCFKRILKEAPRFLYKDVTCFLKKWQNKINLILLSYGEERFQRVKICSSKIEKYFEKIIVTKDINKTKPFKKIFKKHEKIVVIEDNPNALLEIKKNYPYAITVRINRGEGKYKDLLTDKRIDFSIKNLKEFSEILRKIRKKPKTLLLFSGGLDSILAAKILMEQNIKVKGITFKSYFFDAEQAKISAKEIGLPIKIIDFSQEHLAIVKKPKYGYGKGANPCIDCHILMLKKAKEFARKHGFDFVSTGEVLSERPMSQNKKSLKLIEEESSLKGYLLRPLSAKLLEPSIPERLRWVDRTRLLDISGKTRKRQIELAKEYKIKTYPSPGGGCLLTDLEFSKRLKELLKIYPQFQENDIQLLKVGRHFWERFQNKQKIKQRKASQAKWTKIIVGRNEKENKKIKRLSQRGDILIEMRNYPGPLSLIRGYPKGKISKKILEKTKKLTQYYSPKARNKKDVVFKIWRVQ